MLHFSHILSIFLIVANGYESNTETTISKTHGRSVPMFSLMTSYKTTPSPKPDTQSDRKMLHRQNIGIGAITLASIELKEKLQRISQEGKIITDNPKFTKENLHQTKVITPWTLITNIPSLTTTRKSWVKGREYDEPTIKKTIVKGLTLEEKDSNIIEKTSLVKVAISTTSFPDIFFNSKHNQYNHMQAEMSPKLDTVSHHKGIKRTTVSNFDETANLESHRKHNHHKKTSKTGCQSIQISRSTEYLMLISMLYSVKIINDLLYNN